MIRLQIGHPLEMLPNLDGFRFRGVEENGDLTPCKVIRQENGLHTVVSEDDGSYCFYRLRGWMQWLPKQDAALNIKGEA
jgi:hypothetical protein